MGSSAIECRCMSNVFSINTNWMLCIWYKLENIVLDGLTTYRSDKQRQLYVHLESDVFTIRWNRVRDELYQLGQSHPNDYGSCVCLGAGRSYKWRDHLCSNAQCSVCEIDMWHMASDKMNFRFRDFYLSENINAEHSIECITHALVRNI